MAKLTSASLYACFACGTLAGCAIGIYVYRFHNNDEGNVAAQTMTYADTAVIVLTCVTIIITCAALVIGMLGIFGYQKLKHDACEASVASALIRIESEMGDGGVLKKLLEERGDEILANYNRKRTRSEDWGKEETEYGE